MTSIIDCRFILCKAKLRDESDGGSVMVWRSNGAPGCSNSLFADSHSECQGGAATYYVYSRPSHKTSLSLFLFCFFKNNSANLNPGNDVYFQGWLPDIPFLHCFSLTQTKRIYPNNHDDWLPQANIKAKITEAENEFAYVPSSLEHLARRNC